MCFKGESGAKNKQTFREHFLEEPDEKVSVCYSKVYDYFQIEFFYKTSCENCEHWTLYLACVKRISCLHYGIKETTIPFKTFFNLVSVLSFPQSTCSKTEVDVTVNSLKSAFVDKNGKYEDNNPPPPP